MDAAIFSVSLSHLILGTMFGVALSSFLWYPARNIKFEKLLQDAIDKLFNKDLEIDELKHEIDELTDENENLRKQADTMQHIKHIVDRLYENDQDELSEESEGEGEEEVVPNLPPPPPAIRCSHHRCESCEEELIGST